jgi:hypothetical protein
MCPSAQALHHAIRRESPVRTGRVTCPRGGCAPRAAQPPLRLSSASPPAPSPHADAWPRARRARWPPSHPGAALRHGAAFACATPGLGGPGRDTRRASTNDTQLVRDGPVSDKASIRRDLSATAVGPSLWKPSRGPGILGEPQAAELRLREGERA